MAKVPFSKLQAKVNSDVVKVAHLNASGEELLYEVKYYLPFMEKLGLVSRVINQSIDDNGFYNPMRVKLYLTLEVVYTYTNLSFTDKMKEDPFKLYDILVSTGIFTNVVQHINEKDWAELQEGVWSTIKNIYDYRNSAMGVLEAVSADYSQLDLDATEITNKLSNKENMELLRDVLAKLG
jgi:hypothetical protein